MTNISRATGLSVPFASSPAPSPQQTIMNSVTRSGKRKNDEVVEDVDTENKKARSEEIESSISLSTVTPTAVPLIIDVAVDSPKAKTPKKGPPSKKRKSLKKGSSQLPPPPASAPQPAEAPRSLNSIRSEDAIPVLASALDAEDYKNRVQYFWGRVFLSSRDFTPAERKAIFEATLPASMPTSTHEELSGYFESGYIDFVQFFMGRVQAYALLFLKSPAGTYWKGKRDYAVRQKRPKAHPVPPPPKHYLEVLSFMGKPGLVWSTKQATDFWSKCLHAVDTIPASPDQIGWIHDTTDPSKGPTLYDKLTGISLELVRRYAIFEAAHPGGYSDDARRHDLRAIMSSLEDRLDFPTKDLQVRPPPPPTIQPAAPIFADDVPDMPQLSDYGAPSASALGILQHNLQRLERRQTPENDDNANEMATLTADAAEVRAGMEEEFKTRLEEKIARANACGSIDPVGIPLPDEFFVPTLADPVITSGPYWTRRAEIYASADIWQRQLMARRDNELHCMRLDALVDAALTGIEALQAEKESQQQQILALEKRNQRLAKAYAEHDAAQAELDRTSRELEEKTRGMGSSMRAGGMLAFKHRRAQPHSDEHQPTKQTPSAPQDNDHSPDLQNFPPIVPAHSPPYPVGPATAALGFVIPQPDTLNTVPFQSAAPVAVMMPEGPQDKPQEER